MAVSETPAPAAPPEAPAKGRNKMLVLVIVAVLIVAGLGVAAYVLLSKAPPPTPPAVTLDRVQVAAAGGRTSMDQAENLTFTAVSTDTEGRIQTDNTTFQWSANPASGVRIYTSLVTKTVRIFGIEARSVTITANGSWNNSAKQGSVTILINPLHFVITPSVSVPPVGAPFSTIVEATRADSTVATTYLGKVHFTSDDSGATLPADYTYQTGDAGSHLFSVTLQRAGAVTITADDTLAQITGSASVTTNRPPVASFTLTPNAADPREVTATSTSTDPDGDPLTYAWTFGDSTPTETTSAVTHTYATHGTYTIQLTVTDNHALSDSAQQSYLAKTPPTASFSVGPLEPSGPDFLARVDASASSDPDGTISTYNWTWGDGTFSELTAALTTHVYDQSLAGQTVTIVLRVTDNDGLQASASQDVQITLQQLPPVADFTYTVVQPTRTVSVDASTSTDPNGNIAYYNWTWGDGTTTNGISPTETHQYLTNGDFILNLTVEDTTNLKGWMEQTVTILKPQERPIAAFTVQRSLLHVDVDGSASSDPDNDIASYSWDFNNDGTEDATGVTAANDYATPGLYTIKLTVTDSGGRQGTATKKVSVSTTTLDYEYYDFFDVPFGEWWDWRFATYGDLPINADCFNQTSIADGVCTPADAAIPDSETYPYTNWYPLPGNVNWNAASNNPMVYAPYRMRATGVNVPGYNRSEPVFLPVLNYAESPGSQLDFRWDMQYLDYATGSYLSLPPPPAPPPNGPGCPGVNPSAYDGFYIRSRIELTMDLQTSRRIFGVVAADATAAQTWWDTNTNPACSANGAAETAVENWFLAMGGPDQLTPGKYDIASSFEWYYVSYYLNMTATVEPDGTTHVYIDHAAGGTEVVLSRMFYWGNASYLDNHLDSTKAAGWWGMELAWFEDFTFAGSLGALTFDFTLSSAMQYHFQQQTSPGPNGLYDRTDDFPYWSWGPILTDYTNDYFAKHPQSELDRYPSPFYGYIHSTPGGRQYGVNRSYDYPPIRWDLQAGQTWHFQFPSGNVVFYDPINTPVPANPQGAYIAISAPLKLESVKPAGYGDWDATNLTWDVYGPASPGGPVGSPGADGTPGTADDEYALDPWPSIRLMDPPSGQGFTQSVEATQTTVVRTGWTPAAIANWSIIANLTSPPRTDAVLRRFRD